MEPLLWTFEDLSRFAHHPDAPVRRWAKKHLTTRFPDQAGEVLVTLLDDPGPFIAHEAIDFLGKTGQPEKYGPILLEHLQQQTDADDIGRLAQALAELDYCPALPLILDHVRRHGLFVIELSGFSPMAQALGKFGGDDVRQIIWTLLEQATPPDDAITPLMKALLEAAQPDDIPRLVRYYRDLPVDKRPTGFLNRPKNWLEPFATAVQADRLLEEMRAELDAGLWAVLEQAEWWLGSDIISYLDSATANALERAFLRRYTGVIELILPELQHLAEERGDDLAGWQVAWEAGQGPQGYRRRALYSWLILQALAQQPMATLTPRTEESVFALALLAQWHAGQDDQAYLEAAEDKTEALLEILASPRQQVLPDVIERLAALGPDIVPRLLDRWDPDDAGWSAIRIIEAIKHLARRYPGSCDAAIPRLIDVIYDGQGDYILEEANFALEAIGPPAVEAINHRLRRTQDMSTDIYLTGALGAIPVESAAQVALDKLTSGQPVEEYHLMSLTDIGLAAAIEPLYQVWQPDDHILAECLLILCEINGVTKPELPEWRRLAIEQDKKTETLLTGKFDLPSPLLGDALPPPPPLRPWQLPRPQSGGKRGKKARRR